MTTETHACPHCFGHGQILITYGADGSSGTPVVCEPCRGTGLPADDWSVMDAGQVERLMHENRITVMRILRGRDE